MALIDREATINAINQRAEETGGIGRSYYERAMQIIANIPEHVVEEKKEESKWVYIKTKPKRKMMYLTYINCPEGKWIEINKYLGKGQWSNPYDGSDPTDYVEAWMPLPEVPDMPKLRQINE